MLITINRPSETEHVMQAVRSLRPDIPLIVRARDAEHARKLYDLGATDAVPETIEASLQLSEAALVGIGVPTGPVIASIHEKRDEFRAVLQGAGGYAGQAGHRSVHARREADEETAAGAGQDDTVDAAGGSETDAGDASDVENPAKSPTE